MVSITKNLDVLQGSCGPNQQICLGFDYRHVNGEYNEFTINYTPINRQNLKTRAELLLDQYGRTGEWTLGNKGSV